MAHDQLTPALSPISRSASPGTPRSARSTRFGMPGRSATSPLPRQMGPPSPELTNLDCAFPPFPTTRARSTTPTESKRGRSSRPELPAITERRPPNPVPGPLPPRSPGGDSVLQRMNSIVPGPFGVGELKVSLPSSTQDGTLKPVLKGVPNRESGLHAVDSHKDVSNQIPNQLLPLGPPVPHQTSSDEPLDLSLQAGLQKVPSPPESGRSQPPAHIEPPKPEVPALDRGSLAAVPSGVAPVRPPRPDDLFDFGAQVAISLDPAIQEPVRIENRSQTFPLTDESRWMGKGPSGPLPRRPSEPNPVPRARRPTVITALRPPLNPALSESQIIARTQSPMETGPLPQTNQERTSGQLPANAHRRPKSKDAKIEEPSPAPIFSSPDKHIGNQYHTPRESSSSSGSGYRSDGRSGSSRSSPPTSEISVGNDRKLSNAKDIDNLMDDIETSIQRMSPKKAAPSPTQPRSKTPSFSRPLFTKPLAPPRLDPALESPESPMDPAIQDGLIVTRASLTRVPPPPPPPAEPSVQPPKRRPTTSRKGNCRGCGEVIVGKSVSSADGRLTGRYHKPCKSSKVGLKSQIYS